MKWKKNSAILLAVLLIAMAVSVATAYDFDPGRDINLRDRYDIKNVVDGDFVCLNISGDYRCEWPTDPSGTPQHNSLAGLQGGTTGERYHMNESIYNKLVSFVFSWITADYFDQGLNTTDSPTFVNLTAGWLKGRHNWTEDSVYLSFDGSTLSLDDSFLNDTIDARVVDAEEDPFWAGNDTSVARIGDCPSEQFVQNTTTGGVECAVPAGGGDITGVFTTLDDYLYNGSATGNVYLRFNETVLNNTIDIRTVTAEKDPYFTGNKSDIAFTNINETFDENLQVVGDILAANFNTSSNAELKSHTFAGGLAGAGAVGMDGLTDTAFFGYRAGANSTGKFNTFVGAWAGDTFYGRDATLFGFASGYESTGDYILCFGDSSCANTNGSYITALGAGAGQNYEGNYSTFVGRQAGHGSTGNNIVAIGHRAGKDNTLSDQFILKQTNVNAIPLIQGNFSSGYVGIGTISPQNTLNVIGDGNFTGLIYGNGSQMTGVITTANEGNLNVNSSDYWDGLNTSADLSITESQVSNLKNYVEAEGDTMEGTLGFAGYPFTISSSSQIANLNASYAGTSYDLVCTNCIGGTEINESSLVGVNAGTLDTYDSGFFMPLNTSPVGTFSFNGGWASGGLTISGGDIYAQAGYFYDIVGLNVSNLNVNGSLLPAAGFDNTFDIGNNTLRWKDLYLSGEVFSNSTGDSYFLGDLGIGTASPSQKLHVEGSANITTNLYVITGNTGIGTSDPTSKLHVVGDANVTGTVYGGVFSGDGSGLTGVIASNVAWNRTAPNVYLTIPSDLVIIGKNTPTTTARLEIYANATNTDLLIHEDLGTHEPRLMLRKGVIDWYISNTDNLSFQYDEAEKMTITQAGLVGIGTATPLKKLDVQIPLAAVDGLVLSMGNNSEDQSPRLFFFNGTEQGNTIMRSVDDLIFNAGATTTSSGSMKMVIQDDGNVGIGTSSPGGKLEVSTGTTSGENIIASTTDATAPSAKVKLRLDALTNDPFAEMQFYAPTGDASEYLRFNIRNTAGAVTEALVIDRVGNVGIGTSSPGYSLDVGGDYNVRAQIFRGHNDAKLMGNTGNTYVWVDDSPGYIILEGGNVGIGTDSPASLLEVSGGNIEIDDTAILGTRPDGTNFRTIIGVQQGDDANGVDVILGENSVFVDDLLWLGQGEVGIGTLTPGAKLDVRGSAIFNEDSADVDFRIESDTNTHSLFVQGSDGLVGIGTDSPEGMLHTKASSGYELFLESTQVGGAANIGFRNAEDNWSMGADATPNIFYIGPYGATQTTFVIETSGEVGIGTGTPDNTLDIVGTLDVSSTSYIGWVRNSTNCTTSSECSANCPTGTKILGGGGQCHSVEAYMWKNRPLDDDTWVVACGPGTGTMYAYVVCARVDA